MRPRIKRKEKKKAFFAPKRKFCRFCTEKAKIIDYKEAKRLESFVTERGKILSSRISGNCAKHQRIVAESIKRARFLGLLPYTR